MKVAQTKKNYKQLLHAQVVITLRENSSFTFYRIFTASKNYTGLSDEFTTREDCLKRRRIPFILPCMLISLSSSMHERMVYFFAVIVVFVGAFFFSLYSCDVNAYKPILKILFRECNIWLIAAKGIRMVQIKKNKTKQKLFKMLSKKKIFGIYFFGMFIV